MPDLANQGARQSLPQHSPRVDRWRRKSLLRRGQEVLTWRIAQGSTAQGFLDARWIPVLLRLVGAKRRRRWALRILSWSPHYFIADGDPGTASLSREDYFEHSFAAAARSRARVCREVLANYLSPETTVLDLGCGPGLLAAALAPQVEVVHACDIARGALACAEIVCAAPNIRYLWLGRDGLDTIADHSVDLAVSLSVIQHLNDVEFDVLLARCAAKLRSGGHAMLHVQLEDPTWRSESSWVADRSLRGRLRYHWGLHCFGRSEAECRRRLAAHGFENITVVPWPSTLESEAEDLGTQVWFAARRGPITT